MEPFGPHPRNGVLKRGKGGVEASTCFGELGSIQYIKETRYRKIYRKPSLNFRFTLDPYRRIFSCKFSGNALFDYGDGIPVHASSSPSNYIP